MRALLSNNMWDLIHLHPYFNNVDYHWIFHYMFDILQKLDYYKAYIVTQGVFKQLDLDLNDTFSIMVTPSKICIL